MPRYAITVKAGRFVAGQSNIGVGTILTLTDKQAEHELRLGTLVPVDAEDAATAPQEAGQEAQAPAKAPTPPKGKKVAPAPAPAPAGEAGDASGDE